MKMFKTFMCLAAVAMAFTGCSTDEFEDVAASKNQTISFSSVVTRTAFGEPDGNTYPTLWSGNEKIRVGLNHASNSQATKEAQITTEDNIKASWTAEIEDDGTGSYTFYALSPAAAFNSTRADGWSVKVPEVQTPLDNSCDEAAQILVAKSKTYTEFPSSVSMHFQHFTAYGKLTLKNLNLNGATVQSIALTAEDNIVGRYNYTFASDEIAVNSGSATLTINTDKTEDVWFAIRPCDLATQALKVVVTTDKGTFTKEVEVPEGCAFKAGVIAKMTINMEGVAIEGPKVWTRIQAVDELSIGDEVVIAAQDYDYAISTTQNNNNRAQAAINRIDANTITIGDAVQVFTVEAGTEAGTFAFNTGSGYIYAASSSGNQLKTQSTLDANASWRLTFDSSTATLVAIGSNLRNTLQYNQGSSLFACYSSASQKQIAIYKNGAIAQKTALATPEVTATAEGTTITATWAAIENAANYTVTCLNTITEATTSQTVTEPTCTFTELASATEHEISVVANPAEGDANYKSSAAGKATVKTAGDVKYTTIAEIQANGIGTYNIKEVTVVAVSTDSYANSLVTDGTGYLYAYCKLNAKVGDVLTLTGASISEYSKQLQIATAGEITVVEEGTTVTHPTPEVISAADYDTKSQTGNFKVGDYVQLNAVFTVSGNYLNFEVPGSAQKGSLKGGADFSAYSGQFVQITGYVLYNTGTYYTVFATGMTEGSNYLYTEPATFEWAATATDAKVATVKADHTWSVTSKPEWLTVATDATSVTMTPSVNEVTEAREGKVVLTDELGATWSIDVKQAAATAAGEVVVNFISGDGAAQFSNDSAAGTNSATNGAITILHEKGTNSNAVRLDTPLRVYQGATLTFSGANISKIEFTYSGSSYAKGWTVDTGNGTISTNGLVATYTCDGEANIKFSASGQNRLSKIVVTYTE